MEEPHMTEYGSIVRRKVTGTIERIYTKGGQLATTYCLVVYDNGKKAFVHKDHRLGGRTSNPLPNGGMIEFDLADPPPGKKSPVAVNWERTSVRKTLQNTTK